MAIHSSGQTVFNHTGEEVDEVAGGASGMGVDRISEVGDRANEGLAAGSLARKGTRGGIRLVLTRS